MPELPEVETIIRGLKPAIGKKIVKISASWPKTIQGGVSRAKKLLINKEIKCISRRAKYIIYQLDEDLFLVQHLRMTGRMILTKDKSPIRFERARIILSGGFNLAFADQRKFGRLEILNKIGLNELENRLGPEPLDNKYTSNQLHISLDRTGRPIKAALLDQGIVAGLGNIYADESLFIARIDPRVPANRISKADAKLLWKAIRQILRRAISHRGTTFQDYRDADGKKGEFFNKLAVYGRKGLPCLKCKTILSSIRLAQRQTVWCSRCQPPH